MSRSFDLEVMRRIGQMELPEAKRICMDWIGRSTRNVSKRNQLLKDISKARSSEVVEKIIWNTYMVGIGMGLIDSGWQKQHGQYQPKETD